jgi:hypothetical protein
MPRILEANLLAEGKKFALIASRFNDFITDKLVSGAVDALLRSGARDEDIDIVKVPGAFEIPLLAKKMAAKTRYDAIICLGADNTKILEAFGNAVDLIVETYAMSEAVKVAYKIAERGDTVLLSPACASFDLFQNYEDRGNQFKEAVKSL